MNYYALSVDEDGVSGIQWLTVAEIRALYQTTQIYDETDTLVNDPANGLFLDSDKTDVASVPPSSSQTITTQSDAYTGVVTISGTSLTFESGLLTGVSIASTS
jgi:hypothetical protein